MRDECWMWHRALRCQRTSTGETPTCLGYSSRDSWISFWSYSSLPGTVREALMLAGSLTFRHLGGDYLFTLENAGEIQSCIKKSWEISVGNVLWWKVESSNLHLTSSEVHHQYLQSSKGQHHSVLCTGKRANSLGFGNVRHTEMFNKKFSNELHLFQHLGTTISH